MAKSMTQRVTAHQDSGRTIIERAFSALESGDLEAAKREVAEDFVMEWPQAGATFRGRDAAFAAVESHPEKPDFEGEPLILGSGDVWVVQASLRYRSGPAHYVNVIQLRDGKVAHATEYWAVPEAAALFDPRSVERSRA